MAHNEDRFGLEAVTEEIENLDIVDKEDSDTLASDTNADDEPTTPVKDLSAPLLGQFRLFAQFGDKTADGSSIKLSQSDKWFKQAKVIQMKGITTTDTGIAFRKIAK